eukprot:366673_1
MIGIRTKKEIPPSIMHGIKSRDKYALYYDSSYGSKWPVNAILTIKLNYDDCTVKWYKDTTQVWKRKIKKRKRYFFAAILTATRKSCFQIVETPHDLILS